MKKLLITGILYFFSILASAEVQVQIDASKININEPFRLTLTQNNLQNGGGVPDLTPLRKEFMILGTERSVNYALINGQSQSSSIWTITLKAQKSGILTIPAIKVGAERTTPLTINITNGSKTIQTKSAFSNDQQQDVLISTEVNEEKPYVNQQIIYKVKISNAKQLLDANYQGPKVENALLIPLGSGKRYQTQKNGTPYWVEEQDYAVFPQKSGTVTISSPIFTGLVYDFNPQRVQVENQPIKLEVQPVPKQFSGKEWLPAKNITLREHYEKTDQDITQGNTLIRTVILQGIGIPAQLLPTLNFAETDGFNAYPEKGKENNQVVQSEIRSHVEIKVTYLFNKSGKITIPELKLPWFNTTTGKEETATLPSKVIEVKALASTPTTVANQESVSPEQKQTPAVTESPVPETTAKNYWAWAVAAFFACAWLFTLILWALQKQQRNSGKRAYKKAIQELHDTCIHGNPQSTRDALIKWANLHWPDATVLNLTQLSQLIHDAALKKQIHHLSQVLYKNTEKTLWRGDELWCCIQAVKRKGVGSKFKKEVLPSINPT